ncbi:hypothetical protein [Bosea sp. RAC05]|uniref:hypothetical protein n=1 Tax=Bosea sp. RAC05 TaxID=1842539 RepID=UPI00083E624E|nr:hypothetical protein [Bosea sp. RAC05]AOG02883.1 hypothetical protein BSY19_5399 [Bosea sp. RAC05]
MSLAEIRRAYAARSNTEATNGRRPISDVIAARAAYVDLARNVVHFALDEQALDEWWDAERANRKHLGIEHGDLCWAELVSIVEAHRHRLIGPVMSP